MITVDGLTGEFGGTTLFKDISFQINEKDRIALMGKNGAGKSTLMNILYGLYHEDSGEIIYEGKPVRINGPNDAIALNIGMVHQHFMLVQPFTVAENLILGDEPVKGVCLDMKKAKKRIPIRIPIIQRKISI